MAEGVLEQAPELQDNGWISVPWKEFIGKDGRHGASFSSGWDNNNQATFNILVFWEDGLQAEQDILGVSWFDGTSLHRTPPVRHPFKPWLRAERIISAQPIRWDNKLDAPAELYGNGNSDAFSTMSVYTFWLLSIGFTAPKYRIVDDTTLENSFGGHEWNRFCIVEQEPEFMTITREIGTWSWADTTIGPAKDGFFANPQAQVSFNGPWGSTITSWRIKVRWVRVPRYGLFGQSGSSDFINQNIATATGLVHNGATPLWDAPGNDLTGVLRFINAHAEPQPSPFSPTAQGVGGTDPNLYYDVTLNWHWFDPPYGNANYRGHNLAPSPGKSVNGVLVYEPFWYLITNGGFNTTTGDPVGSSIYPTADLSTVFQLSTD